MSISRRQESFVTGIYAFARRSGILNTAPGQWIFSHAYFQYKRRWEDPYHALLARYPDLLRGGNILDIGANIGYTSVLFNGAIDPRYKVYAFEPDEFNFRLLERAARGRNIQAQRCAIGETDGAAELAINPRHHGDHKIVSEPGDNTVRVPLMAIDTFVAAQTPPFPVRFIKIDVQGYELAVCRGMSQTLAQNPQAIITLEYSPAAMRELGFEPRDLQDRIAASGRFTYLLAMDGSLHLIDIHQVIADRYIDLLLVPEKF